MDQAPAARYGFRPHDAALKLTRRDRGCFLEGQRSALRDLRSRLGIGRRAAGSDTGRPAAAPTIASASVAHASTRNRRLRPAVRETTICHELGSR